MRVARLGLLLLAIARDANGIGCPVMVPAGAWPQAAQRQAVSAGRPNVDVPLKSDGFNRTVAIEGLCSADVAMSSSFTCQGLVGEFRAGLAAASPVVLKLGAVSCALSAISIYKTPQAAFEAEMRLQFTGCTTTSTQRATVTSAAVVVGIRKDPVSDFNLLPWTEQVCKIATTTAPAQATVSAETDATSHEVGAGTCLGTLRKKISGITDRRSCKLQCISSSTKAQILGGVGCRGFAFNLKATGSNCITYSGAVKQSNRASGWQCYTLSYNASTYAKATPPPANVVKDAIQVLDIRGVLGTSSTAYMQQILPPLDAPTCFSPMWWFTLEDRAGQPLSVPVKLAHWDALMKRIPEQETTTSQVSASMVVDRVLVDTCSPGSGWGREACFVPPSANTQCRSEELTGAIVSGVITSLLTWALVGLVFLVYTKSAHANTYQPLNGRHHCKGVVVCILTGVAAGGACLWCWISMQFLNAVIRSGDCYSPKEFLVVIVAVVLSVTLTIIILLQYMGLQHPAHGHPLLVSRKVEEQKSTKLMLVEVEEGRDVGSVLDTITASSKGQMYTSFTTLSSGHSNMG